MRLIFLQLKLNQIMNRRRNRQQQHISVMKRNENSCSYQLLTTRAGFVRLYLFFLLGIFSTEREFIYFVKFSTFDKINVYIY